MNHTVPMVTRPLRLSLEFLGALCVDGMHGDVEVTGGIPADQPFRVLGVSLDHDRRACVVLHIAAPWPIDQAGQDLTPTFHRVPAVTAPNAPHRAARRARA